MASSSAAAAAATAADENQPPQRKEPRFVRTLQLTHSAFLFAQSILAPQNADSNLVSLASLINKPEGYDLQVLVHNLSRTLATVIESCSRNHNIRILQFVFFKRKNMLPRAPESNIEPWVKEVTTKLAANINIFPGLVIALVPFKATLRAILRAAGHTIPNTASSMIEIGGSGGPVIMEDTLCLVAALWTNRSAMSSASSLKAILLNRQWLLTVDIPLGVEYVEAEEIRQFGGPAKILIWDPFWKNPQPPISSSMLMSADSPSSPPVENAVDGSPHPHDDATERTLDPPTTPHVPPFTLAELENRCGMGISEFLNAVAMSGDNGPLKLAKWLIDERGIFQVLDGPGASRLLELLAVDHHKASTLYSHSDQACLALTLNHPDRPWQNAFLEQRLS
ncbi:hypothetical protein HDU93_000908 [Gonapodya sp. JEL0774]|nr:hypothetical protein HDU93_000908 [Gonapodya sp. JEL0774]